MPAPSAAVDICNLALDKLGQPPIANFEAPKTQTESIMARHYDQVRRRLLREYIWNFAKFRKVIPRAGTPEFDYADYYNLPNDFIRFLSINDSPVEQLFCGQEYDIQGRQLLCNAAGLSSEGDANSIKLRYQRDVTDVSQWDSLFTELMILSLAEATAYKFTLKKGLKEQLSNDITMALPKAVTVDGQERPPVRVQRSKYLAARRGAYTGSSYWGGMYTVIP